MSESSGLQLRSMRARCSAHWTARSCGRSSRRTGTGTEPWIAPEQRSVKMGLLGVAIGSGFVIGPALGGLAGSFDPRLPFWIASGLSLLNALYGYFILPESLPRDRRAPSPASSAGPHRHRRMHARGHQQTALCRTSRMAQA